MNKSTFNKLKQYIDEEIIKKASSIAAETDPTVPSWAKASVKPTYTATEVGALSSSTTVPTAIGDLEQDVHYIACTTTAPTAATTTPKIAFLTEEPEQRYAGWYYYISNI